MRIGIYGWMVASLWAGTACAQAPTDPLDGALTQIGSCTEAVAALAAAERVSDQHQALVDAICAAEAAQPRHDPDTEAALAQWHRANTAAIAGHVRVLMASSDPRDQLAAALIAPSAEPRSGEEFDWTTEEASTAFAAARRLGPNDRLLAWLEALDCPRARAGSGCDPQAALERLQRLEPDNAAVWIKALDQAVARGDEAAIDGLLARAAAASRYEIPFADIGRLLFETLQRVESPPMTPRVAAALGLDGGMGRAASADDTAGTQAMAIASAVAMPAYLPLQQVCSGADGKPAQAHRLPACIATYAHMARDPLLISQMIALTRLVRLTAGSTAGAEWRERLRTMQWVRSKGIERVNARLPDGYLRSLWRQGEMPALEGVLRAAGVPTTPPPGWLPDDERSRTLIGTGRPPPRG